MVFLATLIVKIDQFHKQLPLIVKTSIPSLPIAWDKDSMSMHDTTPQFLSTAEAASMLGLSTTLVQSLVDKNELSGWKTRGGHRRIALQSIIDYQNSAKTGRSLVHNVRSQPKIMVVVETAELLESLQKASTQWQFPFDFKFMGSVTAALLDLAQEKPDMLVVEMAMPRLQQEKTLTALQSFNTRGHTMSIALVTEESGLVAQPSNNSTSVQVVPGPLSPIWLHAFLTGVQSIWRV